MYQNGDHQLLCDRFVESLLATQQVKKCTMIERYEEPVKNLEERIQVLSKELGDNICNHVATGSKRKSDGKVNVQKSKRAFLDHESSVSDDDNEIESDEGLIIKMNRQTLKIENAKIHTTMNTKSRCK